MSKLYTTEEVMEKLSHGPPWHRRFFAAVINSLTWLTGYGIDVARDLQCGLCGARVAPENAQRRLHY